MIAHIFCKLDAIPAPLWTLLGVVVGAVMSPFLTARWQHNQWVLDNKKAEYRELLDLLETYSLRLLDYLGKYPDFGPISPATEADQVAARRQVFEIQNSLNLALADRLFTRKALAKRDVRRQFEELILGLDSGALLHAATVGEKLDKIRAPLGELHQAVLETAKHDLGLV